ncbi:MAG: ATP-binding protein [Actinomycetota bacterium]
MTTGRSTLERHKYVETFPANSEELRNIRSSLRAWVTEQGIPPPVGENLLIAVSEATSNTARHAYPESAGGHVTIQVTLGARALEVAVSDEGQWQHEHGHPGFGMKIIESTVDDFRIDRTTKGTHLTFKLPLREERQ